MMKAVSLQPKFRLPRPSLTQYAPCCSVVVDNSAPTVSFMDISDILLYRNFESKNFLEVEYPVLDLYVRDGLTSSPASNIIIFASFSSRPVSVSSSFEFKI